MRYIKIPQPQTLPDSKGADGQPIMLSLAKLVRDEIGGHGDWRQDEAWLIAYEEIVDELEKKSIPGEIACIEDTHHEKLLAILRKFEFGGSAARPINRLIRAVMAAPKSAPEQVQAAAANGAREAVS